MTNRYAISLDRLCYTYSDGTTALREVTFHLAPGERVGLIGANGAGKSTLLLHLNGLLLPASGAVTVDGVTLQHGTLREVRRRVGLVFQNPDDQLFCPTVFDDVAFGSRNMGDTEGDVTARVRESLASVGLSGVERKCAFNLSMGQKRRAAIATVLAMRPSVIVLDEPTSNLDPRGRREVVALLRALPATMLVATHDLTLVRTLCSRVLLLSQGTLAADGPTEAVLADTFLLESHGLL